MKRFSWKYTMVVMLVALALPLSAQSAAKALKVDTTKLVTGGPLATVIGGAVTIKLSAYQLTQLAAYQKAAQDLQTQQQTFLAAILGQYADPATLRGWDMQMRDSSIVLTPPAKDTATVKAKDSVGVDSKRPSTARKP